MTILNKIIQTKKVEIQTLKKQPLPKTKNNNSLSFHDSIKGKNTLSIIAEIKRASPSKGTIEKHVNPTKLAKAYESNGAAAISVLTDSTYFKGSFDDLKAVSDTVEIPILCKDFMIDPIQIDYAKAAGAQIILLIVAALSDEQLTNLYKYAKELSLDVLVEVHNESELERALKLDAKIIGINNRDLKTFTVDLQTTDRLIRLIDNNDITIVSESGLKTKNHVEHVANAGAHAILVGETFMTTNNLQEAFTDFSQPLVNQARESL